MNYNFVTDKLSQFTTTIFTEMSVLAQKHNAINLGQGFPNYGTPKKLIDAVTQNMNKGNNQYVHMNGLLLLREKIAQKIERFYHQKINPETEITVTPGGTYAIYTAISSIIQPGDEAIIFEPAYDSYLPNILINGGIPKPIALKHPNYSVDWDEVKKNITNKTRLIVINSPHNPTGKTFSQEDINNLHQLTKDTEIIIIADEVYEHLIFDGHKHLSMLAYPQLYERAIVCFSFGKVFNCTGWKMGYAVAPETLTNLFRKVHQFNCFCCNTPVQYGIAECLDDEEYLLHLKNDLQERRDFFANEMKDSFLKPIQSNGTYFQLYAYDKNIDMPEYEMAQKLTIENGVATIPVSAFYAGKTNNNVLRFCFAKDFDTLKSAAQKLKNLNK